MAEKNDFTITRVFNASRDLVWKAHTEAKHLAKWWGPKGFKMLACNLDLRPGGMFHYGMESPDGHTMWGKFIYREVQPQEKLVFVVSFSDENGGTTRHPMSENWPLEVLNTATFTEQDGKTTMVIKGHPVNALQEEEETFFAAFNGMNQGFNGTYDQFEEYLTSIIHSK
ncbi:MAG: polyketide cyclase [Bacteroidetes bacterium]|nr:polyketide cyclase [Bacteroidota bacterium]